MDMDGFAQCLSYIQATTVKSWVDKFLPLMGTVLGAGLAFSLNYYSTARKEARAKIAKKECCEEDIHELMHICKQALVNLLEICEPIATKARPIGHNLPSTVSLPLLDKYYPEIAHSFSVDQRYWIKLVFRYVYDVNKYLDILTKHESETSLFRISLLIINLEPFLLEAYKRCYCILSNKKFEFSDRDEALAELGVTREQIDSLNILKSNAEKENTILRLPNG
ncbi:MULTISPECIES: hypothetical protein [Pseudomonas]|uniref:Phage abortive infection protein n=1 Tax=Pseudomonas quercus TaxID=2722792 RepID=A0ABX0YIG6_9PSED|nr:MULTISPECIES: hypothetical protein [Pseudomonas]MBF7144662.1 hypothetical protein [Pseudomonas sp. LY10J]NJP03200.1 hypothetical protein [Pseudomonas quercus]